MSLALDIENKSQLEIEEMFSKENIDEAIALELSPLLDQIPDTYYDEVSNILGTDSTSFVYDLVAKLGHPKITQVIQDMNIIEIDSLFKFVAKMLDNDIPKAQRVLECSNKILFDVVTIDEWEEEKQDFYSYKAIKIDYTMSEDILDLQMYKIYKLPMLEVPNNWIVGQSGGYQMNDRKCTLNRGYAKQPQDVLDCLNVLQHNPWKLNPEADLTGKILAITEELQKKKGYDFGTASNIAQMVTMSAYSTFEAIGDKTFYYQWDYDFRGRMYCKGYNVSLQGDSYTKGCNIPA